MEIIYFAKIIMEIVLLENQITVMIVISIVIY